MRVKFNQAVHLAGKDYPRGTHEVPDDALNHKFFLRLAEAGLVEDGEAQPVQHQNLVHRQAALHEKIAANQAKATGRPLTDNKAGVTDKNAPVDASRTAEANPVTGKAQLAAVPGAAGPTGDNPAPAMPPAGSGENAAPGQPATNTAGLADPSQPDGSTGSGGGPTGNDAQAMPGAEGFGPKDDGESAAIEESGPDSRDEQPHRKHKRR